MVLQLLVDVNVELQSRREIYKEYKRERVSKRRSASRLGSLSWTEIGGDAQDSAGIMCGQQVSARSDVQYKELTENSSQ